MKGMREQNTICSDITATELEMREMFMLTHLTNAVQDIRACSQIAALMYGEDAPGINQALEATQDALHDLENRIQARKNREAIAVSGGARIYQ